MDGNQGPEKPQSTTLGAGRDATEFYEANPSLRKPGIGHRIKGLVEGVFGRSKPIKEQSSVQTQLANAQDLHRIDEGLGTPANPTIPRRIAVTGGIAAGALGIAAVTGQVRASIQEQPTPFPTSTSGSEINVKAAPSETTPLTNIPPELEGVKPSDYVPGPIAEEYREDQHPAVAATEEAILKHNLTPNPTEDVGDPNARATAQTYETLEAAGKLPTATSTPTAIPTSTDTPQPLEGFAKSQATAQAAETTTAIQNPVDGAK